MAQSAPTSTWSPRNSNMRFFAFFRRLYRKFYVGCIEPKSADETTRRKEFIFNVLMVNSLALVVFAFLVLMVNGLTQREASTAASPLILFVPLVVLLSLFALSRRRFTTLLSYVFVLIFFALGTMALWSYGYVLTEGILAYVLVIVFAGILVSVRAAWIMLAMIAVALRVISYVQIHGITHPYTAERFDPLELANLIIYLVVFLVILVVSWLYTRDIESSLIRARISEAALKRERNSLEIKVRKRTKELEQAQVEQMLQLYRFAEFGRLSATLLHELANPLTSVSIELEQLEHKGYSRALRRARQSVAHMEEYVIAARNQLGNQSEQTTFAVDTEITKVIEFLKPKAAASAVKITAELSSNVYVHGDNVRFYQIVSNLIANAIDASHSAARSSAKIVSVGVKVHERTVSISVRDRGIGIPVNELKKVFEPFYTTKQTDHGTGIGLYITKQAVEEAFGGTITVTSGTRPGTTFTVNLPLYEDR